MNPIVTRSQEELAKASIQVTFYRPVVGEESISITLLLDSVMNNDVTEFSSGTPAYIQQIPAGDFTMEVNTGEVTKIASSVPILIEDEIVCFALSSEETLSYTPIPGTLTLTWEGNNIIANYIIDGKQIVLPQEIVGVARCSYQTLCDKLMVLYTGDAVEMNVLLVVYNTYTTDSGESARNMGSILIPYAGEQAVRRVVLTIKDYCSGNVIPHAHVVLSGTNYAATDFTADVYGEVDFGELIVGNTYDLAITAGGYIDSTADNLRNDSFTVEAEE
jgi:hypothetical protein